ncbi:mitochondrial glutathione transporter SLC25A40-like [Styela clava]
MGTDITPTQQMLASCSGAVVTSLLVTPLDVVKIRLQSQTAANVNKCFLYCNGLMDHLCVCMNGNGKEKWYRRPGQFSGTFDAMIKITRYEGISSLWSGLSPTLVMAVPATVLYFTSYDQLKSRLQSRYGNTLFIPAIAGGVARTGTATIISPLELIRTKMQSRPLTYQEVASVIRQSVQQSGLRSLWTGWVPTILRDVPFSMFYWFSYELIKQKLSFDNLFLKSFLSGFTAGAIATVITHPMDVTKTRRQIALGEKVFGVSSSTPMNTFAVLRDVVNNNGLRGIFSGLLPRLAKIGPACAIMISSYEFGKRFFRDYNHIGSLNNDNNSDNVGALNKSFKT